jgi:hypothetical protein
MDQAKLVELSQRLVNCVEEFYSLHSNVALSGLIDVHKLLMVSDLTKSFLLDDPTFNEQEALFNAEVETLAYSEVEADLDAAIADNTVVLASVYTYAAKKGPKKMPKHVADIVLKDAMASKKTCPITDSPIDMNSFVTECGHIFETAAFENWMTMSASCPMCKFEG